MKKLTIFVKDLEFKVPFGDFVFQGVNVIAHRGDKIALIGRNGTGKTTLLKMVAKLLPQTKGRIETYGAVVYLPQVHFDLERNKEVFKFIEEVYENWWEVVAFAEETFGLKDVDPNQRMGTLSGGELMKIYLARYLIKKPEVLLLDEPTNHIDVNSLAVLAELLKNFNGTVVCATHDAFFIDLFANRVLELEDKTIHAFGGDYNFYKSMRLTLDNSHERDVVAQRQKISKLKKAVKTEEVRHYKITENAKKHYHDRSMARIQIGYFKEKSQKSSNRITKTLLGRKDMANEALIEMANNRPDAVQFQFLKIQESLENIFSIKEGILKVNDRVLIHEIEFSIRRGQKIAILGPNGVGKSIFLKEIAGEKHKGINLTGVIEKKEARIEYISQDFGSLIGSSDGKEADILSVLNTETTDAYKNLVGQLNLSRFDVYRAVESFSGGELTKLSLLDLSHVPVDLLILDEPTNHLDISSQMALSTALNDYTGGLLITSHKLAFISELKLDQIYIIRDQRLVLLKGDYTSPEYLLKELAS